LQKKFPEHEFNILHIAKRIKGIERKRKSFDNVIAAGLIHCNATKEISQPLFTTALATAVLAYGIIEYFSGFGAKSSLSLWPRPCWLTGSLNGHPRKKV
jgi:hypothetical protein